ncbi:major facilitator superfamily-domain-containing protein [Microdochium trichocladiopsis]|uniref:Major facilitator superfamily-domain-containing protein n=1 Tax=Microdochium trichocladiopsis TaxID=1682393 RepID=A0A9P9BH25_9PEZI|nr:major facilitator superfamily-domain-containing protein [Microdochium trichocladiopsis]KAH7018029.1 major facilitator superfamily-domain-containing protein [Microdochium trichocladiopsis]
MAALTRTTTTESAMYPGSRMGAWRRRGIMLSLCLTLFLAALDVTIVATALPTISTALNATAAEYAWVGSSYTLASTSMAPIWAKMSDITGRKSALIGANVCFMAGSTVAALANTASVLVGGRVLQGLGSGGMFIIVTIVIGDLFELKDRAKYYGLTALVWAVAGAVGPVMGGAFTQTIGWRWCFWINLPFDALSLAMLSFVLKLDTRKIAVLEALKALDWVGSFIIVGGTICFLYGLETGASGQHQADGSGGGWSSPTVISLMVVGIALLCFFCFYEARVAKNPLMPPAIFASFTNVAMYVMLCAHSFVIIAYSYFLPLYFQTVLKFSPLISGISIFPMIFPMTAMTYLSGQFVNRTGNYQIPIWFAVLMMTLGSGLLINLGTEVSWAKIVCFQIILGLGTGPLFQVPMIALQSQLQPKLIPPAMSALGFLKNLGTSCSIIVGTVLIQSRLGVSGGLTQGQHDGGGAAGGGSSGGGDGNFERAYVGALQIMWVFYTCICVLTVLSAFFLKRENIKNKRDARQQPASQDESQQQQQPQSELQSQSQDEETGTQTDADDLRTKTSASEDEKKPVEEESIAVEDLGQAMAVMDADRKKEGL